MTIETLLSRLDRPRQTGPDRWLARCPAHADKSPSLSIRELPDGRVLGHCFSGCSIESILVALGLEFSDLYPPRPATDACLKPERSPFQAQDVLKALVFETTIVLCAARDMLDSGDLVIGSSGFERLALAYRRIESGIALVQGGSHG